MYEKMLPLIFICAFFLACSLPGYCQELRFEHLLELDELSNNAVLSIHQDREKLK
jgi:hypothetical protein